MSTKRQKKKRRKSKAGSVLYFPCDREIPGIHLHPCLCIPALGILGPPHYRSRRINYALTAKEMVMSGNWMSPQIYGIYWYDKPIMVYWLLSISYSILGFTDLAARLPSAFCGALSVTLLTWYVRRILKDYIAAIWAGLMLALSLNSGSSPMPSSRTASFFSLRFRPFFPLTSASWKEAGSI